MDESESLREEFGLKGWKSSLILGTPPVPVDRRQLLSFHRGELEGVERDHVGELVSHWEEWHDASVEVLEELTQASIHPHKLTRRSYKRTIGICLSLAAGLLICVVMSRPKTLRDGNLIVKADGTGLEAFPDAWKDKAAVSLSGSVSRPQILEDMIHAMPTKTVRTSGRHSAAIVKPYRSVVLNSLPTFSWNPIAGASRYTISVYDRENTSVVRPIETEGTSIQMEESLPPGVYYWELTITDVDGSQLVAPRDNEKRAMFVILNDDEVKRIGEEANQLRESHLLRALLYLENGLMHECETEIQALLLQNEDTPLLKKFDRHFREAWGVEK